MHHWDEVRNFKHATPEKTLIKPAGYQRGRSDLVVRQGLVKLLLMLYALASGGTKLFLLPFPDKCEQLVLVVLILVSFKLTGTLRFQQSPLLIHYPEMWHSGRGWQCREKWLVVIFVAAVNLHGDKVPTESRI